MKRWEWLGAAAALAILALVLWPREQEGGAPVSDAAQAAVPQAASRTAGATASSAHAPGLAGGALQEAVAQAGAPGSTPPLAQPATESDGFVEARVIAQGKPLTGAKVRLY